MIHLILLFFIPLSLLAAPKDIEVWFLSHSKTAVLEEMLNKPSYIVRSQLAELQCQEMGDYCFDPQFGLYKKNDGTVEVVETKKIETEDPSIPANKSVDRELIECEKGNKFDIFCGKARAESRGTPKLELWIDTSSSMREFDFMQKDGSCYRKSLVRQLDESCGFNQKVNVMTFDTSIKQAGSISDLCVNQGLNDHKRLIDWIERSDSVKLIIITDIYEFHKEFSDYIESKHGKFRGDKDPLTAKQMAELSEQLAKSCK